MEKLYKLSELARLMGILVVVVLLSGLRRVRLELLIFMVDGIYQSQSLIG